MVIKNQNNNLQACLNQILPGHRSSSKAESPMSQRKTTKKSNKDTLMNESIRDEVAADDMVVKEQDLQRTIVFSQDED